ncbi:MAG: hypothetical protein CMQ83_00620 [Gammaproteobacteria bacterium]|nr:hypothetical protein [Gammaproteobacteria bacterium]|tara:strand:- start:232 stop:636 length:405 start_codon:yes stop_codon:yes gene_type:complete
MRTTTIILTFIFSIFILSSCAMVGSSVASASTGTSIDFGLTKAKNTMLYNPEKLPPHDNEAWKQFLNLTCDELRPLLNERSQILNNKEFKVKFNAKDENIVEYAVAMREYSDVRLAAQQNCEVWGRAGVFEKDE